MNKTTSSSVSTPHPILPRFPHIPGRRTYAPGLAVFISRVRLEEQLGGEHPYGYAMNNPIKYIDPSGEDPISVIGKQYTNCKAHTVDCIKYIFDKHGPKNHPCYQKSDMKNWMQDLMDCACQSGNQGADPLFLLAIQACETSWGTAKSTNPDVTCHDQFGIHFNPDAPPKTQPGLPTIGMIRLCHPGKDRNTLGPIPTYKESACAAAKTVLRDGGIKAGVFNSGACVSKAYPQWVKECKDANKK